ncbi:uncharacterized protein [Procambarus clarkii]|uniref:uncharacterized protein n=1 Tax=Procambarus clarkii TaxID=6728 RepID=UPI001E678842|nr:mucin-1-like [Procambarus clarkii]
MVVYTTRWGCVRLPPPSPPQSVSLLPPASAPGSDSAPPTSLRAPSPVLDPSPPADAPVPSPVSSVGGGLVPRVVETDVLRGRAPPAVGRPAAGPSRVPPAGGDSSVDQRPVPKRLRTDTGASPPRSWAVECEDAARVDVSSPADVCGAVGGSELSPASPPMPTADDSPRLVVATADRDLVVILRKDVHQGASAPVLGGGGPDSSVSSAGSPSVQPRVKPCEKPRAPASTKPCAAPREPPVADTGATPSSVDHFPVLAADGSVVPKSRVLDLVWDDRVKFISDNIINCNLTTLSTILSERTLPQWLPVIQIICIYRPEETFPAVMSHLQ